MVRSVKSTPVHARRRMTHWPPQHPHDPHSHGAPMPANHHVAGGQYAGIYAGQYVGQNPVYGGGPVAIPQQPMHPAYGYSPAQAAPDHHQTPIATARIVAAAPTRYTTRLRWENIFPLLTLITLIVAGLLFIGSINSEDGSSRSDTRSRSTAQQRATSSMSAGDIAAKLSQVDELIDQGHYSEAGTILQAMSSMKDTYPEIAEATIRLNRIEAQDARLTRELGELVGAGKWRAARRTLRQIAALHPLSASQQQLLSRANVEIARDQRVDTSTQKANQNRTRDHTRDHSDHESNSSSGNNTSSHSDHGFPDTNTSSGGAPPHKSSNQSPPDAAPPDTNDLPTAVA